MIAHYPIRHAVGIVCDRQNSYGNLYHLSLANVQFVTHIFWQAYEQVLPNKQHQPVSKDSGKTSYIEKFNNTLR